ncbi:DUF4352 domain-containing protein [Actinomadura craniellae]|uniref:DUF4352 domain-containing protein n=1 Tax=Actinomadura craniellae TaxID=2231787 RepID=A0A365HBD4_9ACTN|nr:DUF4352 domain-containing protein [Actinomadura craniellae]RAY16464.1 DUF4352 domain-containing protein [Actinomadura craniellae]
MRTLTAVAGIAILLAATTAACSDDAPATTTYDLPARKVRDGEKALHTGTVQSGFLAFTVIGYTGGMKVLAGSHADKPPRGLYTRVRLVVENRDRSTQTLDVRKQFLITSDGTAHTRDRQSTLIKRQPATTLDIGAAMRIEFDLWYDVPHGAKPVAVRLHGTPSIFSPADALPPPAEVRLG